MKDNKISDEKLTKLLLNDDSSAFDQIYNRYWFSAFNVAYGILQDSALCQDIVQDVFVSLWVRRKQTEIQHLKSYIIGAIKLKVFQHLRNNKISQKHLDNIRVVSFLNETENRVNFHELDKHLKKGMDKLPPKCKRVFYLSRFEQLSNKEIGSLLGISTKTVEGHITYALKYFKTYLKEFITAFLAFFISG